MKRFYRNQLPPGEQDAYDRLLAGLRAHQAEVELGSLPGENAAKVLDAVLCDNPGLVACDISGATFAFRGARASCRPRWMYGEDEAKRLRADLQRAMEEILSGIPPGASDYQKELCLHDYFVGHMQYRAGSPEDPASLHEAHTAIGPLLRRTGVCDGFSRAMTLLLRKAGLPAIYLRGRSAFEQAAGEGHSWNCVWIEGKPYHLDVTWDTTLTQPGGPVRYDYLNLDDGAIALDHYDFSGPACTDRAGSYFMRRRQIAAGKPSLTALLEAAVKARADFLTFKILPGRNGYPPDPEAAVQQAAFKAGMASYAISLNRHQHVVMLSSITYRRLPFGL